MLIGSIVSARSEKEAIFRRRLVVGGPCLTSFERVLASSQAGEQIPTPGTLMLSLTDRVLTVLLEETLKLIFDARFRIFSSAASFLQFYGAPWGIMGMAWASRPVHVACCNGTSGGYYCMPVHAMREFVVPVIIRHASECSDLISVGL